jgi:hypothetical protein
LPPIGKYSLNSGNNLSVINENDDGGLKLKENKNVLNINGVG